MKANIFSIKNRFNALILFLLVIGALLILIFSRSMERIDAYHHTFHQLNTLKTNYLQQKNLVKLFLTNETRELIFYKTGNTKTTNEYNKIDEENQRLIREIINAKIFKKQQDFLDNVGQISVVLKNYSEKFQTILNTLSDRGFQAYGLVGNMNTRLKKLNDLLNNTGSFELIAQFEQISGLIESFSTSFSQSEMNDALYYLDQIRSMVNDPFINPNTDLNPSIINEIELLESSLSLINEKNEDIGITGNKGIIKELYSQELTIDVSLDELNEQLDGLIPYLKQRTIYATLSIILLLILISVVIVILLSSSFRKPINGLKNYMGQMTEGALPDIQKTNEQNEISGVINSLRKIIEDVKAKTIFAQKLGDGEFDSDYQPLSDKDILGKALLDLKMNLQKAAEDEKKHKIENEKRRWTNEGLAKFSEILRLNNNNIELLSDNIVKNLVKYLNANQGGIYIYDTTDESNHLLKLTSAFAFDRKKYLEKTIELGEGLVGTCALEKQTIYMVDIPEDYVIITSGLGGSNPRCLLLIPLKLEEEVLGVVEIASFKKMETYEIEFVEKIAESIASTLSTARINERTAQLLEKSQKQAQEMAEQEEEMRQNMEELQATQEESARRESEMYGILNAINNTSYVFELDMDGYITEMNDRLCILLERKRMDVIGQHHADFTNTNKNSPEYLNFWKTLKDGETLTKNQKFELSGGGEIWLKQNYTPIFSKEGTALKILCLSSDITQIINHEKEMQKMHLELSGKNLEINSMEEAIGVSFLKCDLNPKGEITMINDKFCNLTGYSRKDLIKTKFKEYISEDMARNYERIWESLTNGHVYNNVLHLQTRENIKLVVNATLKPIINENGSLNKVIFIGENDEKNKSDK